MSRTLKTWTPEERQTLRELYQEYKPAAVAKRMGRSYGSVTAMAHVIGVANKRSANAPKYTPIADADRLLNAKPSDGVIIMPRTAHEHRAAAKWSEARAEDMQPAGYEKSDVQGIKWTAIGLGILALTLAVLYADLRGWL
jgi:hypothetical protein